MQNEYICCERKSVSSECSNNNKLITRFSEIKANQEGSCSEELTGWNETIAVCNRESLIFIRKEFIDSCCYREIYKEAIPKDCNCVGLKETQKPDIFCDCT